MSESPGSRRVRPTARFSINALMQYMVAEADVRRRLIRSQKYPDVVRVNYYDAARRVIARFIAGGMLDPAQLSREAQALAARPPANDNEARRLTCNATAIAAFADSYQMLDLRGLTPTLAPNVQPYLGIAGVKVSVRPEILLVGRMGGKDVVGAVKLYLKSEPLGEEAAKCGTVLVKRHREANARGATSPAGTCMVFDVLQKTCVGSPGAIVARRRRIIASCEEIAASWDGMRP